jgi:hypothetical protein
MDARVDDGEGVALEQVQLGVALLPPVAADLDDPRMDPELVVGLHCILLPVDT